MRCINFFVIHEAERPAMTVTTIITRRNARMYHTIERTIVAGLCPSIRIREWAWGYPLTSFLQRPEYYGRAASWHPLSIECRSIWHKKPDSPRNPYAFSKATLKLFSWRVIAPAVRVGEANPRAIPYTLGESDVRGTRARLRFSRSLRGEFNYSAR